ncbi:MAG: STAS domain-containing protein [Spirulinaceae cyanobacterium]
MSNVVLRPQRNLDIKGASLLQQRAFNLLPPPENSCWVLDLVEVNVINHFGLTALMSVRRAARQHRCRLYLLNIKQPVRYMLEITELETKFDYLEHLDDAFTEKIRLLLC